VLVVNPLVLKAGGLEMEIVEALQRDDDPVPAILLLENERQLEHVRRLSLPFRDFLMKPHSPVECLHRIELALQHKARHLAQAKKVRELESQVSIDAKTGLLSDRHLRRVIQIEFKRAQRHQTPLSLLLIDVDNFKSINDTTEYAFGDEVLRAVADCLRSGTRETDSAARFGGDEFVVLLPQTTPAEAVQTAIRIRKLIGNLVISSGSYTKKVTISVGIDTYDGRAPTSPEDLRRRANKALQEAKKRGKNQVWLYSDLASGPLMSP
jgi:diguanylate cyclase (GGDEF)-like protein